VLVTDEKSLIFDFGFRFFCLRHTTHVTSSLFLSPSFPLPDIFDTVVCQYSFWREQYEQKGVIFLYLKPLLFSQRPGEPGEILVWKEVPFGLIIIMNPF
jgi:hypothetical protein